MTTNALFLWICQPDTLVLPARCDCAHAWGGGARSLHFVRAEIQRNNPCPMRCSHNEWGCFHETEPCRGRDFWSVVGVFFRAGHSPVPGGGRCRLHGGRGGFCSAIDTSPRLRLRTVCLRFQCRLVRFIAEIAASMRPAQECSGKPIHAAVFDSPSKLLQCATRQCPILLSVFMVSIHAPAWGATPVPSWSAVGHVVSIHAPAWGATNASRPPSCRHMFQSTPPRGGRQVFLR